MSYGVLFDSEKCIGCRACQVACEEWNNLPAEETRFTPTYTNPKAVNAKTWTVVRFVELKAGSTPRWVFIKTQCMHCIEPTCVSVCPTRALAVDPTTGAVVYDADRCIGCKYCVVACPFDAIHVDEDKHVVSKCTLCFDRVSHGIPPACVSACPTGALEFDRYEVLVDKARRIEGEGRYVYGLREVGGTRWLLALPRGVKPEDVGLPGPATTRPAASLSAISDASFWPFAYTVLGEWLAVGIVGGVVLSLFVSRRRRKVGREQGG
jgi:formate dehydrogenase iron-sulfur subunit